MMNLFCTTYILHDIFDVKSFHLFQEYECKDGVQPYPRVIGCESLPQAEETFIPNHLD